MATPLRPEELEQRVTRALEAARRRAGLTVDEMVRRLRPALRLPELEAGKVARHNWYDWRRRPHSVPAVALLAAAELAGVSIDRLMGKESPEVGDVGMARLAEFEQRLESVERALRSGSPDSGAEEALEYRLASVEAQIMDLRDLLGLAGTPASAGHRAHRSRTASHDQIEERVTTLEVMVWELRDALEDRGIVPARRTESMSHGESAQRRRSKADGSD